MKKFTTLLIIFIIPLHTLLLAQDDKVLLTIDGHKITSEEFLRIYKKNQQNLKSGEKTDLEDYLDLFINFKLKVIEAQNMGLDTHGSFRKELENHRKELARPYLRDDETMNELLREAYERSKQEIKASQILIKFPTPASYQDTLHAYEKARDIRKRIIKKDETFSQVARATSDDPTVKSNGGDLGYFTALQMLYPFENAAYNMEVNEISFPVKTRNGYHLIKKNDHRKARGKVKVAHIMLLAPNSMPKEKRQEKKEKINEIYHRIKEGAAFEKLARKLSEDKNSAQNGGELPWFGVGKMVPEFEKTAFSVDDKGEISKPFKTSVGWHIIKLIDKKTLGSFEKEKEQLQRTLEKTPRFQIARDALIAGLKKEYHFVERMSNFRKLYRFIKQPEEKDSIAWDQLNAYPGNDSLFVIRDKLFHTGDFIEYLNTPPYNFKKRFEGQFLLDKAYERFRKDMILDYEEKRLPEKFPEYKYLLKEYHDGILLFEIMDRKVWSKASEDTAGLKRYYENHKNKYMWEERFKGKIYICDNQKTLEKVKRLKKGGFLNLFRKKHSDKEILEKINKKEKKLEIKEGLFHKGENPIIDYHTWDIEKKNESEKRAYLVEGEIVPPEPKKLENIRGTILGDYQNHVEEQWIQKLKEKYTIQINQELLNEIRNQ